MTDAPVPRGALLRSRKLRARLIQARRIALLAMVLTGLTVALGLAALADQAEIVRVLIPIICVGMLPIIVFSLWDRRRL